MADTEGITSKTECAEETVEEDKESTSEGEDTEIIDTEEEEAVHTYPSRYRKLAVKGQLLKIEKLKYEFNLCLNKWRKQCNRLRILITDKTDLEVIKFERGILEDLMGDLRAVFNLIDVNEDSCEDFHNFHKECSDRLDFFEMEHHSLIRTVCDNISEKEQEACEINTRFSIGSQLSHSRSSRHFRSSHHSRSSRHSHSSRHSSRCSSHSSHSSNSSVETLMEAAALKAKLKFIDIEAKTSADLEKIKTLKAIEIARAKLETLDEIDGTDIASVLKDMKIIKSEVISPISLTDIPNTLEFNELNSEAPQIVHSFEPHFYTDVSATQVKSHVNSESFIEQSVSNTSSTTSVTLHQVFLLNLYAGKVSFRQIL